MFNFLIPSCVQSELHIRQLFRCVEHIRRYHPTNKIYIINDSDDEMNYVYVDLSKKYENIVVVKSEYRTRGEILCFKFITDSEENDNFFIMHDSMILYKQLDNIESIENIKFLWCFTNHRVHWDQIVEERTEYNVSNNIITHTDLIKHYIEKDYVMNKEFQEFAFDLLINKNKWCGCMGLCCITNKSTITKMDYFLPFIDKFLSKTGKRNRVVIESIFSIICHFFYREENFENAYDGLYYDGIHLNKSSYQQVGYDDLFFIGKNEYIGKVSFGR